MQAMIFAAGLGTRLKPLTNDIPKALVTCNGKSLLQITIEKLMQHGFNDIIINVHHFADKIIEHLAENKNFGANVTISDETDELLDTGGGLKKAIPYIKNEPFLVHNVDIVSDIDLTQLYQNHLQSNALATLAVQNRNAQRCFLINKNDLLCGWKNKNTNEEIISRNEQNYFEVSFSGIQIISPKMLDLITESGFFSIKDTYLRLAKEHTIKVYHHDNDFLIDAGTIENLKVIEGKIKKS